MARPSKATATMSKHLTNEEKNQRMESENRLKGKTNKIKPPSYLTKNQKNIFNKIVRELEASKILGNLDIYVLAECSVAIDRMQTIEDTVNQDIRQLENKELMASKNKYTQSFFRCCNELCLSPQSRAKMTNATLQAKEENPLIKALMDDD